MVQLLHYNSVDFLGLNVLIVPSAFLLHALEDLPPLFLQVFNDNVSEAISALSLVAANLKTQADQIHIFLMIFGIAGNLALGRALARAFAS